MLSIPADRSVCTVIVTVDAAPTVLADLIEHARAGVEQLFPHYPGYLGGALHVSDDQTRLIQYLQWESESDYLACRDDPSWDDHESTRRFLSHIAEGRAVIEAHTFSVTAAS
ncbi:MAG: antibiotic biosynthesis monooxygenase [Acidimicrobiia bacterium]|nr:antibiotic biosynthesis monooxygenase [Acidimicrobiia bacterium]